MYLKKTPQRNCTRSGVQRREKEEKRYAPRTRRGEETAHTDVMKRDGGTQHRRRAEQLKTRRQEQQQQHRKVHIVNSKRGVQNSLREQRGGAVVRGVRVHTAQDEARRYEARGEDRTEEESS